MTFYHSKVTKFEAEHEKQFEFSFQEEFIEALLKLLDLAGFTMLTNEEQLYSHLQDRVERDKERIPGVQGMMIQDLQFKERMIKDMLNFIEKKMVKKAPKYFADETTFPLEMEDYPKYNCMHVSLEFLRNCDKFNFSTRIISQVQNQFDKIVQLIRRDKMEVKSFTPIFQVEGIEDEPRDLTPIVHAKKIKKEMRDQIEMPILERNERSEKIEKKGKNFRDQTDHSPMKFTRKKSTFESSSPSNNMFNNPKDRSTSPLVPLKKGTNFKNNNTMNTGNMPTSKRQWTNKRSGQNFNLYEVSPNPEIYKRKQSSEEKAYGTNSTSTSPKHEIEDPEMQCRKSQDLSTLKQEMGRFQKENSKTADREVYEEYFTYNKDDFLKKYDLVSIIKVYLEMYKECYYNVAQVRAEFVRFIVTTYSKAQKPNLTHFSGVFNDFLYEIFSDGIGDDYPHINKSVSIMLSDLMHNFDCEIVTKGNLTWNEDEDMLYEQKYLYKMVFGEVLSKLKEKQASKHVIMNVQEILEACEG